MGEDQGHTPDPTLRPVEGAGAAPLPGPAEDAVQPDIDVRIIGNGEGSGEGLVAEDPVAKATREQREAQEGQGDSTADDIGAVALTPEQVELQKHDDDPEHPRGNPELAQEVANHIVDIQKNDDNPNHPRGNQDVAQGVAESIVKIQENDAKPEHTRGNPEMSYFIGEALNAVHSVSSNIKSMPDDLITPEEKQARISALVSDRERIAADAMQEFSKEKKVRDNMVASATRKIVTNIAMGEKATGDQLAHFGREGSSDKFKAGQSSDIISKHSTNMTLKEVLATAGVNPDVLTDEGWDTVEGSAEIKQKVYESTIPGFEIVETRYFIRNGEPDYSHPTSITLDLRQKDSSTPEISSDDSPEEPSETDPSAESSTPKPPVRDRDFV